MPQYIALEPPVLETGPNSTTVAFRTPVDPNISGYSVYYKIYADETDFNAEEDESKWFDPGYYIDENSEMQPGPVIPSQRGFVRVGILGASSLTQVTIPDPGVGTMVYIDFDFHQGAAGGFQDISVPPTVITGSYDPLGSVGGELARGVIDPQDTRPSKILLNFNGDWNYDAGDSYQDADMKRRYGTPLDSLTQSGVAALTTFLSSGTEKFDSGSSELLVGIVVHSFGFDPVLGTLYSIPVLLKTSTSSSVRYSPMSDIDRGYDSH